MLIVGGVAVALSPALGEIFRQRQRQRGQPPPADVTGYHMINTAHDCSRVVQRGQAPVEASLPPNSK